MKRRAKLKTVSAAVIMTLAATSMIASNNCTVPTPGGGCAPPNVAQPFPNSTPPCATQTCNGDATTSYCGGSGGSTQCADNKNGAWSCSYKYYKEVQVVNQYGITNYCDTNQQLPPGAGTGPASNGGSCDEAKSNGQKCN